MLTYKKSGVDVDKANSLVDWIKKLNPTIGGFSGLYPIDNNKFLSASCDGVGTKLKVAHISNKHDTVGIDLVAMNVNDVICSGAKPLFFLDYFACGKLDVNIAKQVIKGIKDGCDQAGCVLLGGETAEMPSFYQGKDYDLAGFTVGIVEKKNIIDGSKIRKGDVILGLPSSGLHSNGFSLVRKAFSEKEIKKYSKVLITPTKIYVKEILNIFQKMPNSILGICHITGGGFYDNIVRILPKNLNAIIDKDSWKIPEIFKIIQLKGRMSDREIFRTLNMGIGMILVVRDSNVSKIQKLLKDSIIIGRIENGKSEVIVS
ncbi:MAG TPA: phosphoribosylformylglycinamidine cyclo-ligase [Elusimicrobia bacterium]|nr:MAG: phosphoribosylformylglycinamidine cyclo-ligase [Elusimicrobia bacterium RIFOXYD2_FULL_34_30]HAM38732.1 phosphoribosylformylglycinamidine cyclo-ligase [Elusimicrobiota bacterium]